MDLIDHFRRLFEYDAWANRKSLASLETAGPALERPLKLLGHVIGAQQTWLARIEHRDAYPPWPELSHEQCEKAIEYLYHQWKTYLEKLAPQQLDGNVIYRNTKGVEFRTRLADLLQHVATHSAYHRGQVAAAVREAGGKPASTDFAAYAREHPQD